MNTPFAPPVQNLSQLEAFAVLLICLLFVGAMGAFCPLCLLCQVSERMGEGCMFVFCCYGAALFGLRVKLRTQENIQVNCFTFYRER